MIFATNLFRPLFAFPLRRTNFVCCPLFVVLSINHHTIGINFTARSIFFSSVIGPLKCLYQCRPVKAVCFSNAIEQNACNVSNVSKFVKPLTVTKPICLTIVSKGNISNASIVSQYVTPLNINKSMNSSKLRYRNVDIVNSITHHIKPLNVAKSDCSCNISISTICKSSKKFFCRIIKYPQVVNPVRESIFANHSKRARKRAFNVTVISIVLQNHLIEGMTSI